MNGGLQIPPHSADFIPWRVIQPPLSSVPAGAKFLIYNLTATQRDLRTMEPPILFHLQLNPDWKGISQDQSQAGEGELFFFLTTYQEIKVALY